MPYYLCSNELGVHACASWEEAKRLTQGHAGSWAKKYSKRAELLAALAATRHVPAAARLEDDGAAAPVAYVDGSCVLGEWSACAVFFSEGSGENEVQELGAPHTAPRAELAAVLLCLEKGFRSGRILSDSVFVCRAFARGWPEAYAHQDLMGRIRDLWTPELSVVKVPAHAGQAGNEAVDAMLRRRREERRPARSTETGSSSTAEPPPGPTARPAFLWQDL